MTMNQTGDVTVLEGDSVSISCFSTGNPVPTITWYLGTSVAPFPQSDTVNELEARVTGSAEATMAIVTNGNITSILRIENASYPAHDGEYTCVGLNSNRGGHNTNNATINVQVRGKHNYSNLSLFQTRPLSYTIWTGQMDFLFAPPTTLWVLA